MAKRDGIVGLAALLVIASTATATATERQIDVEGGTIDVSLTGTPPMPETVVFRWVETSARGVALYLGRFPVPHARLFVRAGGRRSVGGGVTYGGRDPRIRIMVGADATEADLHDDWVLTHEMTHLGFPDLSTDDSWAEEGLATYVEPMARMRAGTLGVDRMWAGLVEGLPQGLPRRGDRGLHGTGEWGRTYWGGALFWLLADVELREKTGNRKGLPDALAAILDAGGDIRASWSLVRTLGVADRALGVTVLSDLYRRLGTAPGDVDLDALWRRLGIRRSGDGVTYDDHAPQAAVRRAIAGR
jgi:hypothetical protein